MRSFLVVLGLLLLLILISIVLVLMIKDCNSKERSEYDQDFWAIDIHYAINTFPHLQTHTGICMCDNLLFQEKLLQRAKNLGLVF